MCGTIEERADMATETAHLMAMMMAGDLNTPLAERQQQRAESREHFALLVARARAGDATAFERIMLETERKVVSTAWRMLGNREDARDATQEVYLRVYKYLDRFKPEQDFQGWLYRITINVCRDVARKQGRGAGVRRRGDSLIDQWNKRPPAGVSVSREILINAFARYRVVIDVWGG